mgnify:CR=1 FL=1
MRAGRLIQLGTPAEMARQPADEDVARLLDTPRRQAQRRRVALRAGAMSEALALLPEYLSAHVRLTLAALVAGVLLLAVPAGVLASRVARPRRPVAGLAGVIQTRFLRSRSWP